MERENLETKIQSLKMEGEYSSDKPVAVFRQ